MLKYEQVKKAADDVVIGGGKEEFIYRESGTTSSCFYVPTTDPRFPESNNWCAPPCAAETGCLVGEILRKLGLLSDVIAASTSTIITWLGRAQQTGRIEASHKAGFFLDKLQTMQDGGQTWGDCLKAAIEYASTADDDELYEFRDYAS